MTTDIAKTTVDGRYFWKLVFDYDNSKENNDITVDYTYEYKTTLDIKEFISRKFGIESGFSYKNKQNASVKFEGLVDVGGSIEYEAHIKTALEFQNTFESAEKIERTDKETRTYKIGAYSKMRLYQLCYTTDGALVSTRTFANDPRPDLVIKLNFSCKKSILGFDEIVEQFSRTFPSEDNKVEWSRIRETILTNLSKPQTVQFKAFVDCLSGISPGRDNIEEWKLIRKTCNEIITEFDNTNHQLLFNKLLHRFSTTTPGKSNRVEWEAIRNLSNRILKEMKQHF